MDLTRVIIGPVITEKAERQKASRTHTIRVDPNATKVDLKNALRRYYDIDVEAIRVLRTSPKGRQAGRGQWIEKRHREKRMLITLKPKSKAFDLTAFKI